MSKGDKREGEKFRKKKEADGWVGKSFTYKGGFFFF